MAPATEIGSPASPRWGTPVRMALLVCLAAAGVVGVRADGSTSHEDAYVREAEGGRRWAIGNQAVSYTLALDRDDLVAVSLGRGGEAVALGTRPDTLVAPNGDERPFGRGTAGFVFLGAEAATIDGAVVLTLGFRFRQEAVVLERHYKVYPAAPVVEMWTTVDAEEDTPFRDLNALRLELPARELAWVSGLRGGDAGAFAGRQQTVAPGERVELGSPTLSSETTVPYAALTGDGTRYFWGLAWSGAWRAVVTGTERGAEVDLALPDMSAVARAGRRLEFPHAFLGVTVADPGADAEAFAAWLARRRGGRAFPALSTFNTWFTHGIRIDADKARADMDYFAALGGELFQLDAGWYAGREARDQWDFTAGLGSWTVDRSRFPEGLGVLSDYAHARGLRFGLWVEPERVALSTVGRDGGAEERFLATADGQYQPGTANAEAPSAQICLADRAARQWVLDRLVRLIDEARPDYLKWDVNFWIRCTRPDHDHPADGGNHGHVMGLYEILGELRARYPSLLIENCSGGGHRIDAELLTRTDASWMDDRSAPSTRVRSHLEALGAVMPASALLSYVMAGEGEPLAGADDMRLLARSRMPGALGLTVPFETLREAELQQLTQEIALYHAVRQQRGEAATILLSDAVRPDGSGPGWDVVQQVNPATGSGVVFAFRNDGGASRVRVRLQRLDREATYGVRSVDAGSLGRHSGAELMDSGIELAVAASHVVYVERQ